MIKILIPLGIGFLPDFGGFWVDFEGMLASKIEQKSMLFSRGDFLKKTLFFIRKNNDFEVLGFKVGSKNRSKIDQKMKS